jgi:hypothetical protein
MKPLEARTSGGFLLALVALVFEQNCKVNLNRYPRFLSFALDGFDDVWGNFHEFLTLMFDDAWVKVHLFTLCLQTVCSG